MNGDVNYRREGGSAAGEATDARRDGRLSFLRLT